MRAKRLSMMLSKTADVTGQTAAGRPAEEETEP